MTALVIQGDARRLPLPDESVDLIVTSPPYFALRSYTDDGQHYAGQIGSEQTWQQFIAALVDCTREWVRVLKPSGSMFVDLGDKYSGYNGNRGEGTIQRNDVRQTLPGGHGLDGGEIPNKSLMLLPERYRIACVDDLGLIARAVLVWSKPNGLPESVTDRVRRSHEDWVHLTKRPRYFSAVDEIRQPYAPASGTHHRQRHGERTHVNADRNAMLRSARDNGGVTEYERNPLGALPGSVWSIPTEPLKLPAHLGVDHFAAFPSEWPRRLILGWSPPGVCVECGAGRRPVTQTDYDTQGRTTNRPQSVQRRHESPGRDVRAVASATITGYACDCPTPGAATRPAVILDPFGGTGTTAAVASALGRTGITVDLSHDYSRVSVWRCQDTALAGKVQGRMWADRQGTLGI